MQIRKFIDNFRTRFEPHFGEEVRETFSGELRHECGKLFYIAFVIMVIWLPYIPDDLKIHRFPMFALAIRLGLTFVCIATILLRFTKLFNPRPDILLEIIVAYLFFGSSAIAATAGSAAVSYTGGYAFVIMTPLIAPLSSLFKIITAVCSLGLFFLLGILTSVDFSHAYVQYSIRDLVSAIVIFIILSVIQYFIKHQAWQRRQELRKAMALNEENLKTISTLASTAEASDRAKSEFLATMSHEIRTPMNAIIGIAQIELQKEGLPDEFAVALERIYSSGNSLLGIINDILDMSKIETGKLVLNPAEYEMPSLINDAVQLNIVRIGSKPIEFTLEIEESLPSRLYGDELRIKQILNNLLSNAIKYTEKGSVKLSVRHASMHGEVTLRITVRDTGQGMRPEDLERLFSEYSRFNAEANRTTEGTGLGLSITKRLVELMDGLIDVDSDYGVGSVFTVLLKQKAVPCSPIGAELAEKLRSFTYISTREAIRPSFIREIMPYGTVLLVDDVDTNLYVAEGLLAPYKLRVETAGSGFTTLDLIKSGKSYDVIFMDHMMPLMDGIETTGQLRALGYDGAIVVLTANALVGNDEMFLEKGFDGFISKPIDIEQLNMVLNRFVRDRHPDRDNEISLLEKASQSAKAQNPEELLRTFADSAAAAIPLLLDASASGSLKLYSATIHAMKSALADIGEHAASGFAVLLADAALRGDTGYISANTKAFTKRLATIIKNRTPQD